jgi:hypothetical protein
MSAGGEWYGAPNARPRLQLIRPRVDPDHLPDTRSWHDCRRCLTPWFRFQAPIECGMCHNLTKTKAEAVRERVRAKRDKASGHQKARKRPT